MCRVAGCGPSSHLYKAEPRLTVPVPFSRALLPCTASSSKLELSNSNAGLLLLLLPLGLSRKITSPKGRTPSASNTAMKSKWAAQGEREAQNEREVTWDRRVHEHARVTEIAGSLRCGPAPSICVQAQAFGHPKLTRACKLVIVPEGALWDQHRALRACGQERHFGCMFFFPAVLMHVCCCRGKNITMDLLPHYIDAGWEGFCT